MRFQFGMSALSLTTAFVAVSLGGMVAEWRLLVPLQRTILAQTIFWFGPFWLPFVFVAYAVGRRDVTTKWVLAFAIIFLGPFWLPLVFVAYALGRRAITAKFVLAFALSEAAVVQAAIWVSG